MKTEKLCTVTQTNNMKSFGLYFCKAQKKDGAWVVTKILHRIETGSNPSSLAAAGEKLGLIVVNPPTEKSVYIMRGTRQADGEILDPLVDWNGKVIEQCPRMRANETAADPPTHVLISWCSTSKCHAYPIAHFYGTQHQCNKRREQSNFPQSMDVRRIGEVPPAY